MVRRHLTASVQKADCAKANQAKGPQTRLCIGGRIVGKADEDMLMPYDF